MAITENATHNSVQITEKKTEWGYYLEVEAPSGSHEFALNGNTVIVGDVPKTIITALTNEGYTIQ